MIIGAHSIVNSKDPEADRAFFRDVLGLPSVDVGEGWLIFGLPPAEVAVHPSGDNDVHEFYLMCDDVDGFIAEMEEAGVACGPVQSPGWGRLTQVTLPGGGKLGVYEPRHARPKPMRARRRRKRPARSGGTTKRPASRASKPRPRAGSPPRAGSRQRRTRSRAR